jgi:hypothetical protein
MRGVGTSEKAGKPAITHLLLTSIATGCYTPDNIVRSD